MSVINRFLKHAKKHKQAYLFILPSLIFAGFFTWYPLVYGTWMSFFDFYRNPITSPDFVFLDNYARMFTDRFFSIAFYNTLIWVGLTVPINFIIALGIALLLNEKIGRFQSIFRSLILFSWATPWVVSGLIWRWMYNSQWGIINRMLIDLGLISTHISFLSDPVLVWPAAVVYFLWGHLTFDTLAILAALQTVPPSLHEAARVDGASMTQRFRHYNMELNSWWSWTCHRDFTHLCL